MSFFEFFRILFATHFILGAYMALSLSRIVLAGFVLFVPPAPTTSDAISAVAITVLSVLWYFVWYGSIQFALRGRFPVLTTRGFSILLGCVYAGFGIVAFVKSRQPVGDLLKNTIDVLMSFIRG